MRQLPDKKDIEVFSLGGHLMASIYLQPTLVEKIVASSTRSCTRSVNNILSVRNKYLTAQNGPETTV